MLWTLKKINKKKAFEKKSVWKKGENIREKNMLFQSNRKYMYVPKIKQSTSVITNRRHVAQIWPAKPSKLNENIVFRSKKNTEKNPEN